MGVENGLILWIGLAKWLARRRPPERLGRKNVIPQKIFLQNEPVDTMPITVLPMLKVNPGENPFPHFLSSHRKNNI